MSKAAMNSGVPLLFHCVAFFWLAGAALPGQSIAVSDGLTPPGMKVGPVAGSYQLAGFDSVNLFNGKLSVSFPLLEMGGRGEAGYTMTAPVPSANWQITPTAFGNESQKYVEPTWEEAPPARLGPGYVYRKSTGLAETTSCPEGGQITALTATYTTYLLTRPGGGSMEFFPAESGKRDPYIWQLCTYFEANRGRGVRFETRDGSAATLVLDAEVLENGESVGSDGYAGGGDATGYVLFKNGIRYNFNKGEIRSIVDRNGNRMAIDYHPPETAPKSVLLNLNSGSAQGFERTLPSILTMPNGTGYPLSNRSSFRADLRIHDFVMPPAGQTNVIWSSNGGQGPRLVLRNGYLEAVLKETGATAGCGISLAEWTDVGVRLQRTTNGAYLLEAWNMTTTPPSLIGTGGCPAGVTGSVNLSGLMSLGADENRLAASLFKGKLAFVYLYGVSIGTGAPPPEQGNVSDILLMYTLDNSTNGYVTDTSGGYHLTSFGSPIGQPTPGATGPGVGLVRRVTDSLGRTVDVSYPEELTAGQRDFQQTIDYKGYGGVNRTIRMKFAPLANVLSSGTVQTYGELFSTFFLNAGQTHDPTVLKRIELPNNTAYELRYNSCGEVTEVTLPTGGKVKYEWDGQSGGEASGLCRGAAPAYGGIVRFLKTRWVYAQGSPEVLEQKSEYARTTVACGAECGVGPRSNTVVAVTQRDAANAVIGVNRHVFYGIPTYVYGLVNFAPWKEGKEYRTDIVKDAFADAANLSSPAANFLTVTQTWKQYGLGGSTVPAYSAAEDRPRVTQVATTHNDDGVTQTKTDTFEYDEYNNPIDFSKGDWGGGVLFRRMTTYIKNAYDTDLSVHLRSLPAVESMYDGQSNLAAQTSYTYDETPLDLTVRGDATGRDPGVTIAGKTKRGNATTVTRWRSDKLEGETDPQTKQRYDELGNVEEVTDARGNITKASYTDAFSDAVPAAGSKTYGFLTTLTMPALADGTTAEIKGTYDWSLGRLRTATDANQVPASYEYADSLDRPTRYQKNGEETLWGYPSATSTTTSIKQNSCGQTQSVFTTAEFDGLGRTSSTKLTEGGGVTINTLTKYDGAGRVWEQYLPYRSSGTIGGATATAYDWLGRPLTVTLPDQSVRRYGYRVNATWVRDEAGKWTKTTMDSLGRLKEVVEDPAVAAAATPIAGQSNPSGAGHVTSYGYDALGNLRTVTQSGVDTREYVYNSLGWLRSAKNPETGATAITYFYDQNGNLTRRTDGRGAELAMLYDKWNRVTRKTYIAGTAEAANEVNYRYDTHVTEVAGSYPKGRLTEVAVTGGSVTRIARYDAHGRVLASRQITRGQEYGFEYGYNLAGGMEREKYPNTARTVTSCYDAAGRLTAVKNGSAQSADVYAEVKSGTDPETGAANVAGYSALGGMQRVEMDGGKWTRRWDYNGRGQATEMKLYHTPVAGAASQKLKLTLGYANGANNGNIVSQAIRAGGTLVGTQVYSYDALNRLTVAEESGSWKQTNGYDTQGNRWVEETETYGLPALTDEMPKGAAWFDTKNRLTNVGVGFNYDEAGNLEGISSMGKSFLYDVENRQVIGVVSGKRTQYEYDGEGRRVAKVECPGAAACTASTEGARLTVYVYNAAGRLTQEYGGTAGTTAGRSYVFDDHLGSTRMKVSAAGGVEGWWDYTPFGGEIPGALGGRSGIAGLAYGGLRPAMMFTGKERDAETGLDYMDFRYYGGAQGRFMSPDPLMASADVADPQSWNRYVYARNNPLRYTDPLGLFASPAYNCTDTQTSCLNDEQRRVLENSSVKVGKETLSGERLWAALGQQKNGEALQNAFVNITDKLASITLSGGGTALSQVSGLTDVKADRLYANVGADLAGSLAGSSAFAKVSAGDHAPYNAISFKNLADVQGNIQFSFNESRLGADIDIDLGNMASRNPMGPLIHIVEVLQNKTIGAITGAKTSQDAVRKILIANPSVMITPSPDPKWNRK